MKAKPALKRTPIVGDAPSAAPINQQQESQAARSRLTLIPNLETNTPYRPWPSAYTHGAPQSWFRKCNSRGQVVEEGLCLGNDIPVFRWLYTYSTTGTRVQAVLLDASHCLLEKRLYDDEGQLTRTIILAANGTAEQIDHKNHGKQSANGSPGLRRDLPKAA